MAYQKIVVNTNQSLTVLASDTNHIPNLPNVSVITGVSQAVISSTTTGGGAGFECQDTSANFNGTTPPRPVLTSDLIFNTTNPANTTVVAVTDPDVLEIGAGIFLQAAGGENYIILRSNVLIDINKNFTTLGVSAGDIVFNTTASTQALVLFVNGSVLTLDTDIFGSSTSFDDNYTIFLAGGKNAQPTVMQSADCCLLYVGTDTAPAAMTDATQYVNIRVLTCSNNDVTFTNFKVGEYLPIQIKQLFDTGTTASARTSCLAIW
jgi:hypothetical protein